MVGGIGGARVATEARAGFREGPELLQGHQPRRTRADATLPQMGPGALLRTLESLARALGVEVRAELGRARGGGPSRGGACKLNGRMVVFVEASFKGVARALRDAVRVEGAGIPSTKGVL